MQRRTRASRRQHTAARGAFARRNPSKFRRKANASPYGWCARGRPTRPVFHPHERPRSASPRQRQAVRRGSSSPRGAGTAAQPVEIATPERSRTHLLQTARNSVQIAQKTAQSVLAQGRRAAPANRRSTPETEPNLKGAFFSHFAEVSPSPRSKRRSAAIFLALRGGAATVCSGRSPARPSQNQNEHANACNRHSDSLDRPRDVDPRRNQVRSR